MKETQIKPNALMQQIERGQCSFLLQFGGQGAGYLSELKQVYRQYSPQMGDYFNCLFTTLREEYEEARQLNPEWYPLGYDVQSWLDGNLKSSEPALARGVYSGPLILATQIAHYLRFLNSGVDQDALLQNTHASIGHSQGIHGALLVARGLEGEEFLKPFSDLIRLLFWQGYRTREAFGPVKLGHDLLSGWQGPTPTPMAAIRCESPERLDSILEAFQKTNPDGHALEVGLRNGPDSFVISGHTASMARFAAFLSRKHEELAAGLDFLNVSGPYHSNFMRLAVDRLADDVARLGLDFQGEFLKVPVMDPLNGRNLQNDGDLNRYIVEASTVRKVDWHNLMHRVADLEVSHALAFGPGEGIRAISRQYLEPGGVIQAGLHKKPNVDQLLNESVKPVKAWKEYAPVQGKLPDGSPMILNAYSRFTGRPPVFGGGMTPTTVEIDMVLAAASTGRIVEWAGGGQVTEEIFRKRLQRLSDALPEGQGIVVNLLYLDAYLWNLQFPLVRKLKSEGYPIEGVTISAGIPDKKDALEILANLEREGIWLNSFKPGTNKQIASVLEIADSVPERKVIMQVEGGAAGGHHSWEDLQALIRHNYSSIRARSNVILTVGGGIYDPDQANHWLQGTWSNPVMPVDGVFLGTRLMAAKEAATSSTVKEALAKLGGSNWKDVLNHGQGDIVSGRSGLGADIYYASNHWSSTSVYLEKLLSGLSGEEADAVILNNKSQILEALNRTAKPYFGDVDEMTYEEMLLRFLDLTAPGERLKSPEGEWPDEPFVDASFRSRFNDLAERTQSRFAETSETSVLSGTSHPEEIIEELKKLHPEMSRLPVLPEDVQYFFELCRRPGKPVNFIPYLDESLLKWFRSDSLWYSHCEGIDPDSCAWIPGPIAITGIQKINESVVDILKAFEDVIFASSLPSSETLELTEQSRLAMEPTHANDAVVEGDDKVTHSSGHNGSRKPPNSKLQDLCLQSRGLLCTLLQAKKLVRKHSRIPSSIPEAFEVTDGMSLGWDLASDGSLKKLTAYETRAGGKRRVLAELTLENTIRFTRFPVSDGPAFVREFVDTGLPFARFKEVSSPESASQEFYRALWQLDGDSGKGQEYSFILDAKELARFAEAIEGTAGGHSAFAVVAIWKPMIRALFQPEASGDVMRLVHLFQEFTWNPGYSRWEDRQRVHGKASIERITWNASGKEIHVRGKLSNQKHETILEFKAGFLIRGEKADSLQEISRPESFEFLPGDDGAIALLEELDFLSVGKVLPGLPLIIRPEVCSIKSYQDGSSHWLVQGPLLQQGLPVGKVNLDWKGASPSPLQRIMELFPVQSSEKPLEKSVLLFSEKDRSPARLEDYASASGDLNPIHTDALTAREAGFHGPIVHGMWTSARVLDSLVRNVANGDASRIRFLRSSFQAPLYPDREFFIRAYHSGNQSGQKQLDVTVTTAAGEQVYAGSAQVDQLATAYVFTGQGSQSQGMGMKFYDDHSAARRVWDEAEAVTTQELGFSILDIVRNNPEEVRIGHEIFRHPRGVLNLTQFTQVGLVAKAMADWAILTENGLLKSDAAFAGHSLGEYAALASQGILPLKSVIRIVYHRGLTMQSLVPRDSEGNSPYRMTVVLGNRKAGLTEEKIAALVSEICDRTKLPLEIVNFNIRDRQYSVTGHIDAIDALEKALRNISGGHKTFVRIPGIDVPFHSGILLPGVPAFREVLEQNLESVKGLDHLDGRYLPNLVARPFSLDADFLDLVERKTGNSLAKIRQGKVNGDARKLLLIELLAYQFAQPVLWIQTQEYLLQEMQIRRIIDIGARGDLAGMARQTLKQLDLSHSVEVLHVEEDEARVFQRTEDARDLYEEHMASLRQREEAGLAAADTSSAEPQKAHLTKAAAQNTSAITATDSPKPQPGSAKINSPAVPQNAAEFSASTADVNLDARDGLMALLAWKAEIRPEQVKESETIDELFGGNSSKRNQVLADLATEFNTSELEGVQEKKIGDVIDLLRKKVSYSGPGPYLRAAFDGFLKEYMPPGRNRSDVLDFLKSRSAPEGLIILATIRFPLMARNGQSMRDGSLGSNPVERRFASKEQADQWFDQSLKSLAAEKGISLKSESNESTGVAIDSAALADLEAKYFGLDGSFARLIRSTSQQLLGQDPFAPLIVHDTQALDLGRESTALEGAFYKSVSQARFDSRKVVSFDNPLPWIKKNLYREFWELMQNRRSDFSATLRRQCCSCSSDDLDGMLSYMESKSLRRNQTAAMALKNLRRTLIASGGSYYPLYEGYKCETIVQEDGNLEAVATTSSEPWIEELFASGKAGLFRSADEGQTFQVQDSSVEEFLASLPSPQNPLALKGRCILVTGAGPGSIALEVVRNLLSAGATVVLGTSTYSDNRIQFYKSTYQECASCEATLIVAPISQGSLSDIQSFVQHAFDLGYIPDTVLPFGAVGEEGDLSSVNSDSLAGMRVMLLGIQSLLSAMVEQYRNRYLKQRFQFILPLSPNHGAFGKDGLYAEAKLALEVMLRKWYSEFEFWGRHCSLLAVRIGWVRGTGLMALNDVVAPEMESEHGIKTFHSLEMGSLITALTGFQGWPHVEPIMADLAGGLMQLSGLRTKVQSIRERLLQQSAKARALHSFRSRMQSPVVVRSVAPLELYSSGFAVSEHTAKGMGIEWNPGNNKGSAEDSIQRNRKISGEEPSSQLDLSGHKSQRDSVEMPALEDVVCVVGFGEVSPGGSTRTRWALEKGGDLSLEAAVELAWTMGLIEYQNNPDGYCWVDRETKERVEPDSVAARYAERFREGTGIRIVNPEVVGFDPRNQPVYSEIVLEEDFYIPVADESEGKQYQAAIPEQTDVYHDPSNDRWFIRRKAGTTIRVLKSVALDRYVAGQIPDGWDPERYGLSRELIRQVDRVTLFNLISTAEAFLQAGMEPAELFEYIHTSEAGTTVGGGLGGTFKLNSVFTDHLLDRSRQNDALQETLINVTVAYAVTAFLGSTGPIQTPVAACATGGVSLDMAMNLFRAGKARFLMCGGFDEISAEGMLGFGDMEATARTEDMLSRGIEPARMSRPNDSRRGGFVESHGGGLLLLARGDLALEMGLPVYGIIGATATHSDGLHASIPAPGQGLLSFARAGQNMKAPADGGYSIAENKNQGKEPANNEKHRGPGDSEHSWNELSPLEKGLKSFGLTANDIGVLYKHDTSTQANDVNENRLHSKIQKQLGRDPGNPLPVVSQKSYSGHSKAGAASWQMIGLLQCMQAGVIPGNRSLQNVDRAMNQYAPLLFTDETIYQEPGSIKAGLFSTLGFGHVGAIGLLLSGGVFEDCLSGSQLQSYRSKVQRRSVSIVKRLHEMRLGFKSPLFSRRLPLPVDPQTEAENLLGNRPLEVNQDQAKPASGLQSREVQS